MASATVATQPSATSRSRFLTALLPLNSGPGEIASVDGLRAIAALSVMLFHSYWLVSRNVITGGIDVTFLWYYGQTGVHLFFVLSGFLLFMPFARAMLNGRPLPSTLRFFQRRALRILPAYWVCLAVLAAFQFQQLANITGLENIVAHIFLLHDDFYDFNRAIEGPFWTLAVEAQFYLILPLLAWLISRFVGTTGSRRRVVVGVLAVMLSALALRSVDATIHGRYVTRQGWVGSAASLFVQITLGAQGKYLEVFALGMLCSVLFLAAQDESRRLRRRLPLISVILVTSALVAIVVAAYLASRHNLMTPAYTKFYHAFDLFIIGGPLIVGIPYAALLMSVLWGPRWLHIIFAARPLKFLGAISYSLYLWHLPVLTFATRFTAALRTNDRIAIEILVGLAVAIPVAYLSYQFVERPFLNQRRRIAVQTA
jgi:peptidoglycan/LPS O-acetylase OafA/YrhL